MDGYALVGTAMPVLDPEVEDFLLQLVHAARAVPRAQQRFLVTRPLSSSGTLSVSGAGLADRIEVAPQDLRELKRRGLVEHEGPVNFMQGSHAINIPFQGFEYARAVEQRGDPIERVEDRLVRYVESSEFQVGYPEAYAKWREAARLLAEDSIQHATRIGHECREAMIAFASALAADHHQAGGGTVDSIRAVLKNHRAGHGEKVSAFLDALLVYWGTVSDLAQRQEHGAQRERQDLTEEDARRVVWYTALVMQEIDRAVRPT